MAIANAKEEGEEQAQAKGKAVNKYRFQERKHEELARFFHRIFSKGPPAKEGENYGDSNQYEEAAGQIIIKGVKYTGRIWGIGNFNKVRPGKGLANTAELFDQIIVVR